MRGIHVGESQCKCHGVICTLFCGGRRHALNRDVIGIGIILDRHRLWSTKDGSSTDSGVKGRDGEVERFVILYQSVILNGDIDCRGVTGEGHLPRGGEIIAIWCGRASPCGIVCLYGPDNSVRRIDV